MVTLQSGEMPGGYYAVGVVDHFTGSQGVGIGFAEIVHKFVVPAPLCTLLFRQFGEDSGRLDGIVENRIPVFHSEFHQMVHRRVLVLGADGLDCGGEHEGCQQ